jgi:hypothetical protein
LTLEQPDDQLRFGPAADDHHGHRRTVHDPHPLLLEPGRLGRSQAAGRAPACLASVPAAAS